MNDAPTPPLDGRDDERLDNLVRRACRTQVDPHAVDRLRRAWQNEMARPSRIPAWLPLAAAACFALLAGSLILIIAWPREIVRQDGERETPHGGHGTDRPRDPGKVERRTKLATHPGEENEPVDGAAPTPYERLVIHAALQRHAGQADHQSLSIRRGLLQQLMLTQPVDAETGERIAADLGITVTELESELAQLCLAMRGPRQDKAIDLLRRMATSTQSLNVLLRLWNQGAHQDQIVDAVARLAGPHALAACYIQAGSPRVRSTLAAALVSRLQSSDGRLLVELITRSPRPNELLAAVRKVDGPLYAALFAEFDAESRAARYAAARALGGLGDPTVTRRLIEHVETGHRRQEALAALAISREPIAIQFVARARGNPVLATALQSALVQSGTSNPWYGG